MPEENRHAYYLRRERECREAAERAIDPATRETHLKFAQQYAREVGKPQSKARVT